MDQVANHIRFRELSLLIYDRAAQLIFSEHHVPHFRPSWSPKSTVELLLDGTRVFFGKIQNRELVGTPTQESVIYTCLDARHSADTEVIVTDDTTLVEQVSYNARRGNPNWKEGREHLTVGQIIQDLFDSHLTALRDAGAAPASPTLPYDSGELDSLTAVPPDEVFFANYGFTSAIEDVMEWMPGWLFYIDQSTLVWHFVDMTALPELTITLVNTTDVVARDLISENVEEAYTALTIHGRPDQTNKSLSLAAGDLEKRWDTALEDTWTIQAAFGQVIGPEDSGTPTAQSTTHITDSTQSWTAGQWDDGWIELTNADGRQEHRPISSHSSDSVFWGTPLLVGTITSYRVWQPHPPEWYVWRRFRPTDPDNQKIAQIMDPWVALKSGYFGSAITPTLRVQHTLGGTALEFVAQALVTEDGTEVIANMPLCAYVTSPSDLFSAGRLVAPEDVILDAPIYTTPLTARYPSAGYEGTAFDRFSIQNELTVHIPEWRNSTHQTLFEELAEEMLKRHKDVRYNGRIELLQYLDTVNSLGYLINIATDAAYDDGGATTGFESAAILLREVVYRWSDTAPHFTTTLVLNNDRRRGRAEDRVTRALEYAFTIIEIHANLPAGRIEVTAEQIVRPPTTDPFGQPFLLP